MHTTQEINKYGHGVGFAGLHNRRLERSANIELKTATYRRVLETIAPRK